MEDLHMLKKSENSKFSKPNTSTKWSDIVKKQDIRNKSTEIKGDELPIWENQNFNLQTKNKFCQPFS